jgi:hypothetical protein
MVNGIFSRYSWVCVLAGVVVGMGCEKAQVTVTKTDSQQQEVEVAPGKWVTIAREDDEIRVGVGSASLSLPGGGDEDVTRLRIPWQGKTVFWEGNPVPFSLREWEGRLYLIGLDRTDMDRCRFRYYQQEGEAMREIPQAEFPRRIATQNMWLKADRFSIRSSVDGKDRRIYELQLARDIDPEDMYFLGKLTAQVWYHLLLGKDYYETAAEQYQEAAREYKRLYDPIALPTIIRTPPGWPVEVQSATSTTKDVNE